MNYLLLKIRDLMMLVSLNIKVRWSELDIEKITANITTSDLVMVFDEVTEDCWALDTAPKNFNDVLGLV